MHADGGSETPFQRRRRSPSPSSSNTKRARYSPSESSTSRPPASNGHTVHAPGPSDSNSSAVSMALPPLSLSIFGTEPLDEFIKEIADWIHGLIMSRPVELGGQVEVEAKLGLLKYRGDDARVQFPVRVETILGGDDYRFESNMTAAQHKNFNTMLNKLEAASRLPNHPTTPLRYQHTFLVDSFYPSDGRDSDKIRVTRDEKTGEVKECLKKIRLGNLDVYSPKWNADWRVSVNLEVPVSHPIGSASLTRRKDRMSYSHEEFMIDLTQVTQNSGPGSQKVMHELEVEFARPAILLSTAAVRKDERVSPVERDAFDEMVRVFVNNVRILVRNTVPPV